MDRDQGLEWLPEVREARLAAARATTLDELREEITRFSAHPLAVSTPAVAGHRGALAGDSPTMLLGKSPASMEVERGLPFQGKAAQVLRECLIAAGHNIEETYQTHVTPWRPRRDNLPNATQIAFSRPFIEREIELVAPRRIIALGAKVMDSLFGEHPDMDTVMGTVSHYRGIETHCLRNHGYISHFPGEREAFVAALRKAMA